jgi:SagB-type dehydrogenase family enzyme
VDCGRLCGLLCKLYRRLSGGERRLLERGVGEAARYSDVSALYHFSTLITRREYMESPQPPWPGFFKRVECTSVVRLPQPLDRAGVDVLEAIRRRRSRRSFAGRAVSLEAVSTLLYHAVGVTGWDGGWPLRSYPSAGGLQPVEVYLVAERVEGLEPGLYHYDARVHSLCLMRRGRLLSLLADIALGQGHVGMGAGALIVTAVYQRTASKYGARAYRYIHVDAGAAVENVYLAAEGLGLAVVVVGAFYDEELCQLIGVDCYNEIPIAIMPFGIPA